MTWQNEWLKLRAATEPSRPPPCQQKRRLSRVSSRWRTCVTNLVSLVVWVYWICGSRAKGWRHPETSWNNETMPMRWDLCCPPSLSVNSRVQSKASILCLDAHDQENVKYHFQWKICSILNHPDPPLKFSDGCRVGCAKPWQSIFSTKKMGILQKHFFGNVLLKKVTFKFCFKMLFNNSPPKKLQRITTNPEHLWLPQLEPSVSKPVRLIESILLIYINLLWLDDIFLYISKCHHSFFPSQCMPGKPG